MVNDRQVSLRPLEREDLFFVHQLNNNATVMHYWFEEPYETFVELSALYDEHIHDQTERRFVVVCDERKAGLVELVEIDLIHRRAEFQIIISPEYQGKGLAARAMWLALEYTVSASLICTRFISLWTTTTPRPFPSTRSWASGWKEN